MRHYEDITYYENRRRLEKLNKFRRDVILYFNHLQIDEIFRTASEDEEARKIRPKISETLIEIRKIFSSADVAPMIQYTPPPAVGGYIQNVDILDNIFTLHQWSINPQALIDLLDQVRGAYESDCRKSIIRTFNPLTWGLWVIEWVAYIPLRTLGAIGFDVAKAERSMFGKFLKLIGPVAGFMTILNLMGWLDSIKRYLGIEP